MAWSLTTTAADYLCFMRNQGTAWWCVLIMIFPLAANGQSSVSGDLQSELKVFQRDSSIGAANTPQYDHYFTGLDSWLTINAVQSGFDARIRLDVFHNSNLFNPSDAFTGAGIGYFHLSKEVGNLRITGGYFYEQFGSGIVYRSYEDRGLGLDYATFGLHLFYRLNDRWQVTALAGQQKNRFSRYQPLFKGLNVNGSLGGDKIQLQPGLAFLNRTMDKTSMDFVVNQINSYPVQDRFVPKYNVYAFSGYYTLYAGPFTWYTEAAGKTREAIQDYSGQLINQPGWVGFSALSYSQKGVGISAQIKKTDRFVLRTSPNETLLEGVLNFLPPMSRQNALRLPARYAPATQFLGEFAFQVDATFSPVADWIVDLNYSHINDRNGERLWREVYGQLEAISLEKHHFLLGAQYIFYNQTVYLGEPLPDQTAVTPFLEYVFKPARKQSWRFEAQYQMTKQDFGSFLFLLAEYSFAPTWSVAVSDMYNIRPNPEKTTEKKHYYNFFLSYTRGANRFAFAYTKQVAGVNCSGGVCRYEPAFSGAKISVTSAF